MRRLHGLHLDLLDYPQVALPVTRSEDIAWRRDANSKPFFTTSVPGELGESQQTILAGLVWWIGNKAGRW